MAVYGYCRVSTDEQPNEGNSLQAQERRVAGYAMLQDWPVDELFIERGMSGSVKLADRPEGARLLARLQPGDVIVTPRMDRMFRSSTDALVTLEELRKQRISLHMIDLGGDVLGNGVGKLVFTILAAVADNERERIRERIIEVKRDMASRGLHSGGERPFGYDIVPDGKLRRLVPNKEEQRTIAKMRKARDRGDSFRTIGKAFGKPPMTVRRILLRESVPHTTP
jgi:DNA invertase Pin-like site-specific DNA recombinase